MIEIAVISVLVSYLIGCFNTGYYYIHFLYKKDIRNIGTNVTGARNVSRLAGKKGFIITFFGDALKGALAVLLCHMLDLKDMVTLVCILAVLTGHIFPLQLNFRGGKGLSTAFGAFLIFDPKIIIFWLIIFAVMYIFIRRGTVTCSLALLVLPVILIITGSSWLKIIFFLLYGLLINYACRENIKEYLKQ